MTVAIAIVQMLSPTRTGSKGVLIYLCHEVDDISRKLYNIPLSTASIDIPSDGHAVVVHRAPDMVLNATRRSQEAVGLGSL